MKNKISFEDYYTRPVQKKYLTNSQIHNFIGTPARIGCEAKALAIVNNEFEIPKTTDMLIGSYVDAYFEGNLTNFKNKNPQIFKKDGNLYAQFEHANQIINFAEADKIFMEALKGSKQIILEGKIFGYDFLGRLDVLRQNEIVDLKVMKNMEPIWCGNEYGKLNFVDAWGQSDQMAIYQELEYQKTGIKKDCFLAVLTKEKPPDKELIHIPQERLDAALMHIESNLARIYNIKNGNIKPERCEKCDYCRATKQLTAPISYYDL